MRSTFAKAFTKHRSPLIPGSEAAGTVEEIGSGVTGFKGRRRCGFDQRYRQLRRYALVPAAQLIKVPEGLSLELAAAALLQGNDRALSGFLHVSA
ncbi:MAG: alcohol dehydrogenase catalytic domain-containing protein [Terracidiphilus sp.]